MGNIFARKPTIFEKLIFTIGIIIVIAGYFFIQTMIAVDGTLNWQSLQAIFLWLVVIGIIILASVNESMKEELKAIIENQQQELKLLRQDFKLKK